MRKHKIELARIDRFFRLQLNGGVSLALLVEFARDMFPGVGIEDISVRPADDGELLVSVGGDKAVPRKSRERPNIGRVACQAAPVWLQWFARAAAAKAGMARLRSPD